MVSVRINGLTGQGLGEGRKKSKHGAALPFGGAFFVALEVPHSIVNQGARGSGKYRFITVTQPPSSAFLLLRALLVGGIINSSWPKFAE